jgi:predicted GIY-YIG superfamily endonuclease
VRQHKAGTHKGFTRRYGVTRLVYFEIHCGAEPAISREKQLKAWKREWKCSLIEAENSEWNDIARLWDHPDFRPDWNGIAPPDEVKALFAMLDGR